MITYQRGEAEEPHNLTNIPRTTVFRSVAILTTLRIYRDTDYWAIQITPTWLSGDSGTSLNQNSFISHHHP